MYGEGIFKWRRKIRFDFIDGENYSLSKALHDNLTIRGLNLEASVDEDSSGEAVFSYVIVKAEDNKSVTLNVEINYTPR